MTMGWSQVLANSSVLMSSGRSCPSIGPEIAQAHFLEQDGAAETAAAVGLPWPRVWLQADFGHRAFETFLGLVRELEGEFAFGQAAQEPLEILRQLVVATDG